MLGEMVVVELFVFFLVRFVCYFIDSFPCCGSTFIQFYKFMNIRLLS